MSAPLPRPQPRPELMALTPYKGGESKLGGGGPVIKLSSNEGALGPSPAAVEALRAAAADAHRYPDGGAVALREAIAEVHGLDPARIVTGAGSDELLALLIHAYTGPGAEVIHTRHAFLMYAIYARSFGATPVAAPERDLTADVDAILAAVTPATRMVFLANPNNPTGTLLPAIELARLRAGLRGDILLVIDAAYAEYVTDAAHGDGRDLVDSGDDNVVVTRTFSKIHGLGAVRLGWCYAPAPVVDVLNRVRSPFNTSAPAQAAGTAAIRDTTFTRQVRDHTVQWRGWLTDRLAALQLRPTRSHGNFVLARFPQVPGRDAAAADEFLRARRIIVRQMGSYGLPDALRITIGTEAEVRAVADALTAFQAGSDQ